MIQAGEGKGLTWAKIMGMERQEWVRTRVGRFPTVSRKMVGERKMSKSYVIQVIFSFQIFLLGTRKRQKSKKRKRGWDSGRKVSPYANVTGEMEPAHNFLLLCYVKKHFQLKGIILKHGCEINEHIRPCCPQGLSRMFSLDSSLGLSLPAFCNPSKNLCFGHSGICNKKKKQNPLLIEKMSPNLHGWQVLEMVEQMSFWSTQSQICTLGSTLVPAQCCCPGRNILDIQQGGSMPLLPVFSSAEYEPRWVAVHWHLGGS